MRQTPAFKQLAQALQIGISGELTDMKNIKFTLTNFLLVLILSASAVFAANLNADNDKAVALVAQNLSAKLKSDLVSNNLSIKFTNVEKSALSDKEVVLKGEAKAVLPTENTELPFNLKHRSILQMKSSLMSNTLLSKAIMHRPLMKNF